MQSSSTDNQNDSRRHHKFYYSSSKVPENEQIILQVGERLYRVSRTRLAELSRVFSDLLTLPAPEAITYHHLTGKPMPPEGQSDAHPIRLFNASSSEFDSLCAFLFEPASKELLSEGSLLAIMKLSRLWDIPKGMKYVLAVVKYCPTYRPVLELHFGFHYGQHDWITSAFRDLVKAPYSVLGNLTDQDVELLGPTVLKIISATIHDLREHRATLAYGWPPIKHSGFHCDEEQHSECENQLRLYWLSEIPAFLLYPGSTNTYADLKEKLKLREYEIPTKENPGYCIRYTLEGSPLETNGGLLNKKWGLLFYDVDRVNRAIEELRQRANILVLADLNDGLED